MADDSANNGGGQGDRRSEQLENLLNRAREAAQVDRSDEPTAITSADELGIPREYVDDPTTKDLPDRDFSEYDEVGVGGGRDPSNHHRPAGRSIEQEMGDIDRLLNADSTDEDIPTTDQFSENELPERDVPTLPPGGRSRDDYEVFGEDGSQQRFPSSGPNTMLPGDVRPGSVSDDPDDFLPPASARKPARPDAPSLSSQSAESPAHEGSRSQPYYGIHTGAVEAVSGPGADEPRRGAAFFSGLTLGLIGGLLWGTCALAVILWFCVNRWLTPTDALVWTAVGGVIPAVALSILAAWPSSDNSRSTLAQWTGGLIPGVIVGVILMLVAANWGLESVRMQAIPFAPNDQEILTKIWMEPSHELAVAGCDRMLDNIENNQWRRRILANLSLRPAIASQCLETIEDEEARDAWALAVANRWYAELAASEDADESRACQLAASMTELPMESGQLHARLLSCGVESLATGTQSCCLKTLMTRAETSEKILASLELEGRVDHVSQSRTIQGLMGMAFHNARVTQPQELFAKKVKLSSPPARKRVLELACGVLDSGEQAIADHLAASMDGMCRVDESTVSRTPEVWSPVCQATLTLLADAELALTPSDALCESAETTFTAAAVSAASRFVRHSLRSNERTGMVESIDRGHVAEKEQMPDMDDLVEDMMDQYRNGETVDIVGMQKKYDVSRYTVPIESGTAPTPPASDPSAVQKAMAASAGAWAPVMNASSEAERRRIATEMVGAKLKEQAEAQAEAEGADE